MKIMKLLPAIILFLFINKISFGQNQALQLTPAIKTEVVDSLYASLLKNYVFRDTARKMGDYIKKRLSDGDYNAVANPNEFAQILNTDVHSVYNDVHLFISYDPRLASSLQDTSRKGSNQRQEQNFHDAEQQNFGFKKVEILNGNIGYVYFDRFFSLNEEAKETVNSAFSFLKNTNALIIDLRGNGGGDADMVKYICSYFFDKRTHLNDLYERRINKTTEYWTSPLNIGSFSSMPVYILVGRRTFSAAEELTYDLQSQHRATIIGETTGGGAHPVSPEILSNGFIGNIPFARAVNPVTKKNWEAIGVKPDVKINADSALDAAVLSYYDQQISSSKDSDRVKALKWSREMLNAKLHPFNADTAILKTYAGNYANRMITYVGGILFYTGRDGKKLKLIPLSNMVFKMDGVDDIKLKFMKNPEGRSSEVDFIFEDGFVAPYKRKQ